MPGSQPHGILKPEIDINFRVIGYAILFFLFLFPFSLAIGNEGLSANYFFIFAPIFYVVYNKKILLPDPYVLLFIAIYCIIFFVALFYQLDLINFVGRRVISFVLFMFVFSYTIMDVSERMVDAFKIAVVSICIYFTLTTLYLYFTLGGAELGFAAKGEIGSQRFGFVYVLAIWIMLFQRGNGLYIVLKYGILLLLAIGLLLTFSRSGIVALGGSSLIFSGLKFMGWLKRPTLKGLWKILLIIGFIIGGFIALSVLFPLVFEFFSVRLFSFFAGTGDEQLDLGDAESSEGYRIFLIYKALNYILYNPLTGSGFLGIWILFDNLSGSAHNEYLDVLFRTGILGFVCFLLLLRIIGKTLYGKDNGLFWGFVGILIYGFFHETFKLSQGAFILAFLLGVVCVNNRMPRQVIR